MALDEAGIAALVAVDDDGLGDAGLDNDTLPNIPDTAAPLENEDAVDEVKTEDPGGFKDHELGERDLEGETETTDTADTTDTASAGDDTAEPSARGFDDVLLSKASELGVTRETALTYDSPEELTRALAHLAPSQRQPVAQPQAQPEPKPEVPAQTPDVSQPKGAEKFEFKTITRFKPEEYADSAPEVVEFAKEVGQMNDFHAKQIATLNEQMQNMQQLQGSVQALAQETERQQLAQYTERFDSLVKGLGDEFVELLGKGATESLARGSREQIRRIKIDRRIGSLREEHLRFGEPVPPLSVLFNEAKDGVLAGDLHKLARKELASKVVKRKGQLMAPPSRRRSRTDKSPEDQALDAALELCRDRGIGYEDV